MSNNEATIDHLSGSRRIRASGPKAGSVWESRMKLDEFKGGIKVFDNNNNPQPNTPPDSAPATNCTTTEVVESDTTKLSTMKSKQSPVAAATTTNISSKRKTWKSDYNSEGGSPVQIARLNRSELSKSNDEQIKKYRSQSEKNPMIQSRKVRSDQLVKAKPIVARKILDQSGTKNGNNEAVENVEKSSRSDCKEMVVCEEKNITSDLENAGRDKVSVVDDRCSIDGDEEEEELEESLDDDVEIKDINVHEQKKTNNKVVIEEKKLVHSHERPVANSPIVKKQIPPVVVNHARVHPSPTKSKPIPVPEQFHGIPRSHSKLQSFVDLVMWRDVSKSAFIFGIGSFGIISSSYTKDLNISFISVVSYLGLVYLAAIFIFRSLINRRSINMEDPDQEYVVGEEEAIWAIKLVLPYINEFLLKLRALFSGDPATTMKLAVILFILARCGCSITIWKMTRLGFFGVFIVPKVCSSYSSQLAAFGTFWIRRFGDAWNSCSHKKAVGFAIFTLVWNLSSVVARIWAVFVLFVAFKYYQQSVIKEGWSDQEATSTTSETNAVQSNGGQRQGRRSALVNINQKQKKVC